MRTVFIPHIYIPGDGEDGFGGNEAANEESTVVLSVEIQTSDDIETGFAIENVNVVVGGDGAKLRLISWGEKGAVKRGRDIPYPHATTEQYNLLYARLIPASCRTGPTIRSCDARFRDIPAIRLNPDQWEALPNGRGIGVRCSNPFVSDSALPIPVELRA